MLRTGTVREVSYGARWSSWATFDETRRERSIKRTCSNAAESPWLEVSTVGLSCRLLIAGTMQQMALIAIPAPLGLPTLEFSSGCPAHSPSHTLSAYSRDSLFSPPSSRAHLAPPLRFSRILPLPSFLRADSIRRHATPCVRFHLRRQACHLGPRERRDFIPVQRPAIPDRFHTWELARRDARDVSFFQLEFFRHDACVRVHMHLDYSNFGKFA